MVLSQEINVEEGKLKSKQTSLVLRKANCWWEFGVVEQYINIMWVKFHPSHLDKVLQYFGKDLF